MAGHSVSSAKSKIRSGGKKQVRLNPVAPKTFLPKIKKGA